jgi:hypothetical protein
MDAPLQQLLDWLEERERTYAETMEAWASHCPRLTTWEDALGDGLIRIERGVVHVTDLGRAALQAA